MTTGPRRVTRAEIEIFRRSVGAVGQLPPDQLRRLLDEAALLLEEREQIERVLAALGPPWGDVRTALNHLDALVRARRSATLGPGSTAAEDR
jgi:hypothetical protein